MIEEIQPTEVLPSMRGQFRIKGKIVIRTVDRVREKTSQLSNEPMWIVYFTKGSPMTLYSSTLFPKYTQFG